MTFGAAQIRPTRKAMRHARRLVAVGLVAICVASFASSTFAGSGSGNPPQRADLRRLWSRFPLEQQPQSGRPRSESQPGGTQRTSAGGQSSGTNTILIVLGAVAAVGLAVGAVARLKRSAAAEARQGGARHPTPQGVLQPEGGFSMGSSRRKLWTRGEHDMPAEEPQEQMPRESDREDHVGAASVDETVASAADGGAAEAEADAPADRSAGEEVDSILESARAAATNIRSSAADEAEKLRVDADAYAETTRSEADAYAEQARTDAEREAAEIAAVARARLKMADSEANEKVRQVEEKARQRAESLQAEAKRHEERLQRLMVVFRGMTSQLEELLEGPSSQTRDDAKPSNERLDEALASESTRSGVA